MSITKLNNRSLTAVTALPSGVGGKVLQVVTATYATSATTSSGTFSSTGLSASITPSSVSSKILILIDQQGCKAADIRYGDINIKLQKNSSDIYKFALGYWYGSAATELRGGISGHYLDSPASTSSLTYQTVFASNDGGACYVQNDNLNTVSTITLMEIAG